MLNAHMRTYVLTIILATACVAASAQKPVYLCDGTYTDKPCKGGREVDIAPTRGAHSMSGTKRESHEAVMERVSRDVEKAQAKGLQQGQDAMRCAELRRRREAIDRAGQAAARDDERFRIREEQFALKCRRN